MKWSLCMLLLIVRWGAGFSPSQMGDNFAKKSCVHRDVATFRGRQRIPLLQARLGPEEVAEAARVAGLGKVPLCVIYEEEASLQALRAKFPKCEFVLADAVACGTEAMAQLFLESDIEGFESIDEISARLEAMGNLGPDAAKPSDLWTRSQYANFQPKSTPAAARPARTTRRFAPDPENQRENPFDRFLEDQQKRREDEERKKEANRKQASASKKSFQGMPSFDDFNKGLRDSFDKASKDATKFRAKLGREAENLSDRLAGSAEDLSSKITGTEKTRDKLDRLLQLDSIDDASIPDEEKNLQSAVDTEAVYKRIREEEFIDPKEDESWLSSIKYRRPDDDDNSDQ